MRRTRWDFDELRRGFERYNSQNGRLPKAHEIDNASYLPSSRWIQLRYGGLEKLRTELGSTDCHFGKGIHRTEIANVSNIQGRSEEKNLAKILIKEFGEVFVHTEKMFDHTKSRVDFYVYSPDGNFGVDVFCSQTLRNLQSNVNIKLKKYRSFPCELYLVVANNKLTQEDLDQYSSSKINKLSNSMRLLTRRSFLDAIKSKRAYPNPFDL